MLTKHYFIIFIIIQVIGFGLLFTNQSRTNQPTHSSSLNNEVLQKNLTDINEKLQLLNSSIATSFDAGEGQLTTSMVGSINLALSNTIKKEMSMLLNQVGSRQTETKIENVAIDESVIEKSVESSQQIIQKAIEKGNWTHDDMAEIQQYLANLSEKQQYEIMDRFHTALNNNEISIDADVPSP